MVRMDVSAMTPDDLPAVLHVQREGIATGVATLDTDVPSASEWDAAHLPAPRLVARAGAVVGWAALSPVSGRCAYAGAAEVSVYVAAAARGQGVGRVLLDALVTASEEAGLWTLQAQILPANAASLRLHDALGFRVVGVRERIAQHRGAWTDVVLLERRSASVGR